MEIKNILVPTDFSENANLALDYALSLAKRASATVHVVHVPALPPYLWMDGAYAASPDLSSRILAEVQRALDALEPKLQQSGVPFETALREGLVHDAIQAYADEKQIDLVVMGAHGRTGLSKLVYGSVTGRVLKTLRTSAIIVPPQGAEPPNSIVVSYDFSGPARQAARWARTLHGLFHGPLYLVHSYVDVWGEYADRGGSVSEQAERRREALRRGLEEMLEAEAAELFSIDAQTTQTRLITGDPAGAIIDLARDVDAKLICAGSTGKGGVEKLLLGSVARRLLQGSPIPVLITPGEE